MKLATILLATSMAVGAGCYRHEVILAQPAAPYPKAQRREHAWGHLIEDNTMVLTPFCDGAIAKLYQRSPWWSSVAIITDIYCLAETPSY